MKKFIISTLLIFLFISCREESEVIYFTADELIAYCQNNMNCDKDLKKKENRSNGKSCMDQLSKRWIDFRRMYN